MNYSNIPSGLRVQTQIPLDAKINVLNESTLSNLGESNNLAYTYHDKIVVTCLQEGTTWIWKQVEAGKENTGLIPIDFVYPFGITAYGIDYSNKKYNFFRVNYLNVSDQKNYDAASLGDGQPIYKDKTTSGNNITFNFKEISTANSGTTGIPVLSSASATGDNIFINGKRLKTNNLEITEPTPGEILINSPTDVSDIKFYVNENYTGGGSNGSLSKPYNNLKDAFDAFIDVPNGGSIISPKYAYVGTIELLSNVTVLDTGAKPLQWISVNQLRLNGNGYTISYQGSQDYFISTEYLVSLCPKTTSSMLDYTVFMQFKDVTIESTKVHGIVSNLNYKSPTVSGTQNASGISFKNCTITDLAFLQETGSYTSTGVSLFGTLTKVQNSLVGNKYMIKNKDVIWNGEGNFTMENCILNGSSSTVVYNLNSSISWRDLTINFNSYYLNYKNKTGTAPNEIFHPSDNTYYILSENDGTSGRTSNYIGVYNFKETVDKALNGGSIIGGQNAFYRGVGNSVFILYGGSFYSEKTNNLIQLHNENSYAGLNNFDCSALQIAETTGVSSKGAFKYTNPTIPSIAKTVDVNMSTINNVKDWTTLEFIRLNAASAIINGANFTNTPSYNDNSAAKAGGLVPGNIYYDTTGQIATRVF